MNCRASVRLYVRLSVCPSVLVSVTSFGRRTICCCWPGGQGTSIDCSTVGPTAANASNVTSTVDC